VVPVVLPDTIPAADTHVGEDVGDPLAPWTETCCAGDGPDGDGGGGDGGGNGPPGPGSNGVARAGVHVQEPAKVRHVAPVYPELARRAGVRGVVELDCVLDVAGRVTDVRVVRGHPLLDAAAVEAVREWRYRPTLLNGVPVAVQLTVLVRFEIKR
jgi:protein TonB